MATKNGKVKEIWGRQFSIVKNGLNEAEVFSFISRLIDQNNALSDKLEHVDSLKKLAEKAVIQATQQAESIKREAAEAANEKVRAIVIQAEENGKAEAERIIAEAERSALDRMAAAEQLAQDMLIKAEEEAKAQAERIIALGEELTTAQAASIVAEAEQKASKSVQEKVLFAEQQAKGILDAAEAKAREIKSPASAEATNIVAEAKQQMEAAQRKAQEILAEAEAKAESIKSLAAEEATNLSAEVKQKAEYAAEVRMATAREEGQRITEAAIKTAAMEAERIKREAERIPQRSQKLEEEQLKDKFDKLCDLLLSSSPGAEGRTTPLTGQSEGSEAESPALYHGAVLLDFPPPLDSGRVLEIHKHLTRNPQIKVLDMQGSSRAGIRVKVFLRTRIPLLDMLGDLPEVEKVSDGLKPSSKSYVPQRERGEPATKRIVIATKR